MASKGTSGLSNYELERLKNLEENRRILESIRQEQLYALGELQPAKKPKSKKVSSSESNKSRKKLRLERKKEKSEDQSDTENENVGRRKSARLSVKKPKSWKEVDEDDENSNDEDFNCDDDDNSYSDDDNYDSDDGGFRRSKKRGKKTKRAAPTGPREKIVIPKNRPNFYGSVPGVEVGRIWETRMACCADGIHRPTVAGIHAGPEGAFSISLAGGYEDDVDLGDCFTYTGEGGRALKGTASDPKNLRTAPQSKDQTLTRGNLALSLNITSRKPVRVIRGSKLNNEFAPEYGYRYDGLYTVEKYWSCTGKSGFKVFKFALRRCPDQAPPPWVSGVVSYANVTASSAEGEDDDEEAENEQPSVLKVKLFNK